MGLPRIRGIGLVRGAAHHELDVQQVGHGAALVLPELHADVDVLVGERVLEGGGDQPVVGRAQRLPHIVEGQTVQRRPVLVQGDAQLVETAEDVELVDLVFIANSGSLQDASRPVWGDLPVLKYIAPQTFGTSGIMDDGGERLEVVSLPRSFDPQGGELRLEMAPTLGAAMLSALEVLEYSPYINIP